MKMAFTTRCLAPTRASARRTATVTVQRYYSTANVPASHLCPTCHTPLPSPSSSTGSGPPSPTCPACRSFLPIPSSPRPSYFSLLSQSGSFLVDRADIKRQFLKWQQTVHPDLARGAAERAKSIASKDDSTGGNAKRVAAVQEALAREWSSVINKANSTLTNDLSRAEYMLAEAGHEVKEDDSISDDPELLMSILETREALENATTEDQVSSIRSSNDVERKDTVAALATAFDLAKKRGEWADAKRLAVKLRYLENVESACREWAPGKRIELQH